MAEEEEDAERGEEEAEEEEEETVTGEAAKLKPLNMSTGMDSAD